ncbi:hypothetical protein REJ26_002920 [Providencia stuartii]|jgi:hypothetical protein|uniref:Uncharacterized protein n=6 Tax=Gammaproteobacteria TaxID=1236 RepID=A0A899NHZ0_PROST|nr:MULTISPECIES: hypothetical protein [Enterobacterales]URQ57534.1 Hypothetical protein [Providencia alcalifaciens]EKH6496394.1 hypothetical protein [Providencia rettgeri]ELB1110338.1 hypothetical protein [Morganella morganii]ELL8907343.1 hypothetical protein [Proteus mirabilis]ELQ1457919.1 hypothetical protein [Providencia rettgeri]
MELAGKVKTANGYAHVSVEASFSRSVHGEQVEFLVTRSMNDHHLVVTHKLSGRMVCPIDFLATALEGAELAGRKALDSFLFGVGEKRFIDAVSRSTAS